MHEEGRNPVAFDDANTNQDAPHDAALHDAALRLRSNEAERLQEAEQSAVDCGAAFGERGHDALAVVQRLNVNIQHQRITMQVIVFSAKVNGD